MKKLELNLSIDLETITKAVEDSKTLEDNELIFAKLSQIAFNKKQITALLETFDEVERTVKQVINDKAKALYGPNWKIVKGHGYSITKSPTGSVYQISGEPKPEFVEIKLSPKTEAIEEFIKANSTLPEGIAVNPTRNESIRIMVKPSE